MNPPSPRDHRDAPDAPSVDAERERWLTAAGALYDRLRDGSRAQINHAVLMLEKEFGGTVWIQIPSRPSRRTLPEAGYVSDAPAGVPMR